MTKIREPKQLDTYLPADEAASALEQLASKIRACGDHRPLVKWSIILSFWNPRWNDREYRADVIVRQVSYVSGPQK